MLRGISTAKIDRWGKIKIPSEFLKAFKEKYGKEVFISSVDMKNILIYPLPEWEKIVAEAREKADDPLMRRTMLILNRNGVKAEIDELGRILIPKWLLDKTSMKGEVDIEGREDILVLVSKI